MARGSDGAMEKEKACRQVASDPMEKRKAGGTAVNEFYELTRIIPDIRTIIYNINICCEFYFVAK